jgi:hypothetical protein
VITQEEAGTKIEAATERFIALCAEAPTELWVRSPDRGWSMAEVAEHVALANELVMRGPATKLEANPLGVEAPTLVDDEIPFLFYGGDEPPNVATPSGGWTDTARACELLEASARAIIDWSGAVEFDLRGHAVPHPAFGLLDGVQWLLFVAAHIERHRAELRALHRRFEG